MTAPDAWVWLARIRRPQGRKGEVFADLLTDFPEKFAERRKLWLIAADGLALSPVRESGPGALVSDALTRSSGAPREIELTNQWLHKGGIVLHFAGVDSISAAEALKGLGVVIPHSERAPLAEDETYIGDLIGCVLVDVSPAAPVEVGVIEDVDRNAGPTPLLVVHGAKREILVPFAKAYLRTIDLAAKRLEMALPEGLVDLNPTRTPPI
jgi:16S rRNA processing protein RimM